MYRPADEVAAYPFHYYWALRNEYLLSLKREADAYRKATEGKDSVDFDTKWGIGQRSAPPTTEVPTPDWSTREALTGERT